MFRSSDFYEWKIQLFLHRTRENPWLGVVMQHLPSIQYRREAEPLGSQWVRVGPSALSVRMLEVCTLFRNRIAFYNTGAGAQSDNPLSTLRASLFVTYNSWGLLKVRCYARVLSVVWGELQAPGAGVMPSGNRDIEPIKSLGLIQPCLVSLLGQERWYGCNTRH